MLENIEIVEAKLIKVFEKWHEYLEGKKLYLITSIDGNWNLGGIEGETGLDEFCKYIWENEGQLEYNSLEDMQDDVKNANFGFTLLKEEVEILEKKCVVKL